MNIRIFLKEGATEQLIGCAIDPVHQPIPFSYEKKKKFNEELELNEIEFEEALEGNYFYPEKIEDSSIHKRISIVE